MKEQHQIYAFSDIVEWSHERLMTAAAQKDTEESADFMLRLLKAAIAMGYIKPMWG